MVLIRKYQSITIWRNTRCTRVLVLIRWAVNYHAFNLVVSIFEVKTKHFINGACRNVPRFHYYIAVRQYTKWHYKSIWQVKVIAYERVFAQFANLNNHTPMVECKTAYNPALPRWQPVHGSRMHLERRPQQLILARTQLCDTKIRFLLRYASVFKGNGTF